MTTPDRKRNHRIGAALLVIAAVFLGTALVMILAGCSSDADVINKNLAKDADNFKVLRRTVAYNGITGDYLFSVEGFCSVDMENPARYTVTCKVGDQYIKNLVGKSDNVTVFSQQLRATNVSPNHYEVIFKPSVIVPDVETR